MFHSPLRDWRLGVQVNQQLLHALIAGWVLRREDACPNLIREGSSRDFHSLRDFTRTKSRGFIPEIPNTLKLAVEEFTVFGLGSVGGQRGGSHYQMEHLFPIENLHQPPELIIVLQPFALILLAGLAAPVCAAKLAAVPIFGPA